VEGRKGWKEERREGRTSGGGVVVPDEAVHGAAGVLQEADGRVLRKKEREEWKGRKK